MLVFDVGIKSRLYRNRNPLINTSKYSYTDDDTYDNELGNVIVVPDPVTVPTSKYSTIGLTNGISSIFNNTADADVKSTTDCDTVNEPVIIADPENGNGVVDIPDSCEPSPIYVPNDAVETALDDISVFNTNPKLGDIDAVAEPLAICDKFNPTIPDAGIFVRPDPLPSKDPENEPEYAVSVSNDVKRVLILDDASVPSNTLVNPEPFPVIIPDTVNEPVI